MPSTDCRCISLNLSALRRVLDQFFLQSKSNNEDSFSLFIFRGNTSYHGSVPFSPKIYKGRYQEHAKIILTNLKSVSSKFVCVAQLRHAIRGGS